MPTQAFDGRNGRNPTDTVATESYHKSERIQLSYMLDGQQQTATVLVSELKNSDLNTPAIVGIWIVNSLNSNDQPKTPESLGEKLLIEGLRRIMSKNNLLATNLDNQPYPTLTHPENFKGSNLIVLQHQDSTFDLHQHSVQILRTSSSLKFTSLEHKTHPEYVISPSNSFNPETSTANKLATKLIYKYPDSAAKLIDLSTYLDQIKNPTCFSIANATRVYLEQQQLENLVPEAMAILRNIGDTQITFVETQLS